MRSLRSTFNSIGWVAATGAAFAVPACYPDFDALSSHWGNTAGAAGLVSAGGEGGVQTAANGGEDPGGASTAGHMPGGGGGGGGGAGRAGASGGEGGAGGVEEPAPCTPTAVALGAAPVAIYHLDDGSGTVAADSSASEHDATLAGGAWDPAARDGGGLKFSAEGQRLTVPAAALSSLDELTVSVWVNLTAAPAGSTLLDIGTDADNHLALQVSDGTSLRLIAKTATIDVTLIGTYAVPLKRWTQVALTLGDGEATVYLDGRPFARGEVPLKPSELGATADAWVGQAHGSGANLLGTIDDLAIYDRVVDQRELMREVLEDADYAYLTFDEFCSEGALELPAQAQPGTFEGTAGKLPTGGTLVEGRLGKAVQLDASLSQFIELPTGIVQPCTDDLTIAAWFYTDTINTWARVFDLGTGTNTFMYLTPVTPFDTIRFAARPNSPDVATEQVLSRNGSVPSGEWHHLAVVLSKSTGTLYYDGDQAAKNTKLTMNPSDLGNSARTWFGRSEFGTDPYFNGKFDEVIISCRAFTAADVQLLAKLAP